MRSLAISIHFRHSSKIGFGVRSRIFGWRKIIWFDSLIVTDKMSNNLANESCQLNAFHFAIYSRWWIDSVGGGGVMWWWHIAVYVWIERAHYRRTLFFTKFTKFGDCNCCLLCILMLSIHFCSFSLVSVSLCVWLFMSLLFIHSQPLQWLVIFTTYTLSPRPPFYSIR